MGGLEIILPWQAVVGQGLKIILPWHAVVGGRGA